MFEKPLFNYPSLIKTLNSCKIVLHVEKWISASYNNITSTSSLLTNLKGDFSEQKNYVDEKTDVVCTALFKLFIENNISLNELYVILIKNLMHFLILLNSI